MADFSIEKTIDGPVIGLDEVGRVTLAGPVVSCGCHYLHYDDLESEIPITDSKKHTSKQREKLFLFFKRLHKENKLQYHLGYASVEEIDKINILEATKLSMKRVINKFSINDPNLIIDGNFSLNYQNEKSIIGGDKISLSIASASIIAKIHRDRLMNILDSKFNYYHWKSNAGYGTKKHIDAIKTFGCSPIHRKSFKPISDILF